MMKRTVLALCAFVMLWCSGSMAMGMAFAATRAHSIYRARFRQNGVAIACNWLDGIGVAGRR